MKIKLAMIAAALAVAPSAQADTKVTATISDNFKVITTEEPYRTQECVSVNVPVYSTVQKPNDGAEKALIGMIIGGVLGKELSGTSDGATAGAVVGGLIGADKGTTTGRVVTGYRKEIQCSTVTRFRTDQVKVYDNTTITFMQDGVKFTFTVFK